MKKAVKVPDKSAGDYSMRPTEIIFDVSEASEGGYNARALGFSVFNQGEDWNGLKAMARNAVPKVIRLHLLREESIPI